LLVSWTRKYKSNFLQSSTYTIWLLSSSVFSFMCMFFYRCLSVCTFSFGYCVVCSALIYRFWLPLWYLQTLLTEEYVVQLKSMIWGKRWFFDWLILVELLSITVSSGLKILWQMKLNKRGRSFIHWIWTNKGDNSS
jgi:hypothetical protein